MLVGRSFHNTTAFTAVICDQAALPGVKALLLVDKPLVEAAFAQGFPLRLLCRHRFLEVFIKGVVKEFNWFLRQTVVTSKVRVKHVTYGHTYWNIYILE